MNKKGTEISTGIGMLVIVAVVVIVGLVLLQQSATNVALITNTVNVVNQSVTAPAVGGNSSALLQGQAVTNAIVINATSGTVIPASNYTITNYVVSNGQLVSVFTANAGNTIGWQGKSINVSYTYEPFGYDRSGGGRAISGLIIIFFALAIAVAVLVVIVKEDVLDIFG